LNDKILINDITFDLLYYEAVECNWCEIVSL